MYQSRDFKTLDGQSALYDELTQEIDANSLYVKSARNTGSGSSVFLQNNNQNLEFRKLNSNSLTITQNTDNISIEATDYIKTASNTGTSGANVFLQKNGQDLQFRKLNSNSLTITQNTDNITIEEDGLTSLQDGLQTAPSLNFSNATGSGLFKTGTYGVGITTNGSQRMHLHPTYIETFSQIRGVDGTNTIPTYSFSSATNTGIMRGSTGTSMNLVCNGNNAMILTDNVGINTNWQILATDANGKIPYAFYNDSTTGLKRAAANDMRLVAGGNDIVGCSTNNFTLYKPMVSSVQPYSSYYRNTNQTSISGTTTILYDTKEQEYSSDITFASGVYTAVNAGVYLLQADLQITMGSSVDCSSFFTINNSATNRCGYVVTRSQGVHLLSLTQIIYLSINDNVRVQIIPGATATFDVSSNGIRKPRFSILRLF